MMIDEESQNTTRLSWDAKSWLWTRPDETVVGDCEMSDLSCLPALTDASVALTQVYLPMECLLVRAVALPLKSPQMVDAEMLLQELADSTDMEAEQWWLSWQLSVCDSGVAGMVFGLPESLRQLMLEDSQWSGAKDVLVDGYERLHGFVSTGKACAVIDQDADGLFMGFYDGQAWRGMRRLNGMASSQVISQMMCSWQAMGFNAEDDLLCGRASAELWDALQLLCAHCELTTTHALAVDQSRHAANLALETIPALNLRHGSWRKHAGWGAWKQWKRSAILCTLLLCAWFVMTGLDLYRLDHQLTESQTRIETAFHQGLPNETVMLDAMAQLRQAAGGSSTHESVFLQSLQAVSQVYAKAAWQLKLLELRDGKMQMSGTIKDIEALNKMQALLQQKIAREVQIVDTNITGKQVSFRMSW